jgi:biotin carboxyl carrier protein
MNGPGVRALLARVDLPDGTLEAELTPGVPGPDADPGTLAGLVRPLTSRETDRQHGRQRVEVVVDGWRFVVEVEDAARAALLRRASRLGEAAGHQARQVLRAQIPGRIVAVDVAVGESVEANQRLLSLEAMKMENEVRAPRAGTVERVAVAPGQTVEHGDELAVLV